MPAFGATPDRSGPTSQMPANVSRPGDRNHWRRVAFFLVTPPPRRGAIQCVLCISLSLAPCWRSRPLAIRRPMDRLAARWGPIWSRPRPRSRGLPWGRSRTALALQGRRRNAPATRAPYRPGKSCRIMCQLRALGRNGRCHRRWSPCPRRPKLGPHHASAAIADPETRPDRRLGRLRPQSYMRELLKACDRHACDRPAAAHRIFCRRHVDVKTYREISISRKSSDSLLPMTQDLGFTI